jgi:type IV pilus assembly protein PilB
MPALPLFKRGGRLFVGISDPTNSHALDEIKFHTNLTVEPILVDDDKIRRTIDHWLESADALADAVADSEGLDNLETSGGEDDLNSDTGVDAKGDDTPVVKFINKVLVDAIRRGASDIHFEPYETEYRVRLRIDGLLKQVAKVPVKLQRRIAARLKVMAQLDIAEKRSPAGRPHQAQPVQDQADRLPRQHAAHAVRRERWCCVSSTAARPSSASTSSVTRKTRRSCS